MRVRSVRGSFRRTTIADPQNVGIKLWVNDVIKQDSHTSKMIFTLAEQIAHLSTRVTLQPGDLILTGTPAGVGLARKEFLQLRRCGEGVGRRRRDAGQHLRLTRAYPRFAMTKGKRPKASARAAKAAAAKAAPKPAPERRTAEDRTIEDQISYSALSLHDLFEQQTRQMLDRADLDEEQRQNILIAMSCPCCGAGAMSYTVKLKR